MSYSYAGIVRMATAAQTAKAPFIRLADRFALLLLPVSMAVAGSYAADDTKKDKKDAMKKDDMKKGDGMSKDDAKKKDEKCAHVGGPSGAAEGAA